ncbi:MAG: DUF6282 family protein [Acidobacteria bacterium]|nr:DUF6282 family protein [Acidobacteriota bacterium]MCI0723915.1 DUF6282 family protein [Acidobacteriota bacterium]
MKVSHVSIEGLFDLHLHAGPDVRPRKANYFELAASACDAGMGGLLFKSHVTATAGLAALTELAVPGVKAFGGLVLNQEVGGLNPAAVEAALKTGARQIWMPTLSAAHHLRMQRLPGIGISILDEQRRLIPAVCEILVLVRDSAAILGTGHLSPHEINALVRGAREAGVGKILITHPDYRLTALTPGAQRELCATGVFFERCYLAIGRGADWDSMAAAIRAVGVDASVLVTDLGQPDNVSPLEGMREMVEQLGRLGFSPSEIRRMGRENPLALLT